MDLVNVGLCYGMGWSASGYGLGYCEDGNEPSSLVNCKQIREYPRDCWPLKKEIIILKRII